MSGGETTLATPLLVLAGRINAALESADTDLQSAAQHAADAGDWLTAAKSQCGHGGWLPWLETNVPSITARHAQRYMRCGKARRGDPDKYAALSTVRSALGSLAKTTRVSHLPADDLEEDDGHAAGDSWAPDERPSTRSDYRPESSQVVDAAYTVAPPSEPESPPAGVGSGPEDRQSRILWHLREAKRELSEWVRDTRSPADHSRFGDAGMNVDDVMDALKCAPALLDVACGLIDHRDLDMWAD